MTDSGSSSERISPTAYATGYFWYLHGMSHKALATAQGRRMHYAFRPMVVGMGLLSGMSLDATLKARHRGIDELLDQAIETGAVGQIIEIASGLSPRGWRFAQRYGDRITYLDTDLPAMVATKRRLLQQAGLLSAHHQVVELDALAADGPQSLQAVAERLDPDVGTAIITEGLLSYLAPEDAGWLWRNIAATLGRFPQGLYMADMHFQRDLHNRAIKLFGWLLSRFVRGRMTVHFDSAGEIREAMACHGFAETEVHDAATLNANRDLLNGSQHVQILAARTRRGGPGTA